MRETLQTGLSRGRRSRNKVSVGEPAEGSFQQQSKQKLFTPCSLFTEQLQLSLRYSAGSVRFALLTESGCGVLNRCSLERQPSSLKFELSLNGGLTPLTSFFFFTPTFGLGYQRDECKMHQTQYTFQRWTSWFSQR